VSSKVVIDAGVDGNDARFINHSCDPNCETVIEGGRVFIEAVRDIGKGEELGYEYGLTWESTDDPDELANYACRCGAAKCRGSMLDPVPLDRKRAKQAKRRAAKKKAAPGRKKARK
jgi:SET domain-containing protein